MNLNDCPPTDELALIGVSGGRDSVALLHLLATRGHRLIVCHLDHALRAGSREDALFVEKLAARLDCECIVRKENIAVRAKRMKCSIETAAREARYAFFAKIAKARGVRRVFLAHHADDQVETFLFNLLRGSGAVGLGAMRASSMRGNLEIVRPLLGVWREEIDAYIAEHRLEFCEDASNADRRHTRNRVRHEIVPMLAQAFGREVRGAVLRSAEILREEDAFLSALPEMAMAEAVQLSATEMRELPVAIQRRVLLAWLRARGVAEIGFDEVERVRSLLAGRIAKVNLPGGKHARRRAGKMFVEQRGETGNE
jgi:tRNA(Ile)-lysidine synthase